MSEAFVAITLHAHAFSTLAMAGVIWFVQVVHYPLFQRVGEECFVAYEREHTRRTTLIVAPLMLVELTSAALLGVMALSSERVDATLAMLGLALLAVVWGSTFGVQVPLHGRLTERFDQRDAARLVSTNRVRTIAWTARGVVALLMLTAGAGA